MLRRYDLGPRTGAELATTITSPRRRGAYRLRVIARESCGTQTVSRALRVR